MSPMVHRVGAQQWLVLGLLVQAEPRGLTRAEIRRILQTAGVSFSMTTLMRALRDRGLVDVDSSDTFVYATEYGCNARRQIGRTAVSYFLPLPRPYAVLARVADIEPLWETVV